MRNVGLDGCPKADAMLRRVDPYGMTQREGGLSGSSPLLLQEGWRQLPGGDWEFRDPRIPGLVFLQSLQQWTTTAYGPIPYRHGSPYAPGLPDFVLGGDGQVTAERGLRFLQPLQPYVVSEGGLTVSSLYGAAQSPRAHDYEFHLSNPHLRGVDPAAPIPAGTRVYVPHRWTENLRGAGYGVHRPMQSAGVGRLGTAASLATSIATLQAINGAEVVADPVPLLTGGAGYILHGDTFDTYIKSQQAGGQLAIATVSPDVEITLVPIDIAKQFTQQAWVLNGQLAAVNASGSTNHDAATAKNLLAAIIQQYINAANAVVAATPLPSAPGAPPGAAPGIPPLPVAPGVPTPRASATAQQLMQVAPLNVGPQSPQANSAAAAALAKAAADKAAADKAAADKAAGTLSTPWIIGGVVGAAALLGIGVAVLKKKKAA